MNNALATLPKTMLILKSQAARLLKAEAFLRNRGWEVYSTANLKEALIQVVSKKHAYVLISIDHDNSKIPMLPKLIREKFDVAVIAFAESTSAKSFNALTASPTDYKIYAPVTGPAIERCVNKYLKDLETLNRLQAKTDAHMRSLAVMKALQEEEQAETSVFVAGKKRLRRGYSAVYHEAPMRTRNSERIEELRKVSEANDSLIAQATQKSLMDNVDFRDGSISNRIEETVAPTCILIESERFSGYLVAALGKNQKIEETLIQKIQSALVQFLRDNGEHVSENEALNLKLKPVDFEPWALEYAEFLKTTVHQGSEMALAFFPKRPLEIDFEASTHPEMLKIKLQDLRGDQVIEFDLYFHMQANNKFILYTPKGGVFYANQLERLKTQGVTHMHILKKDTADVSRYHAQNYLNDLIDDYEEKMRGMNYPEAI